MLIFWRVMVISCYIYSFHGNHGKFIIPTDSDFSHLARRQDVPQRESHDFHGTVYASRHWWWLLSWFYNPYIYIYTCVFIPWLMNLSHIQKNPLFRYLMAHIFPVARHSEAWCFWISRFRDARRVVLFVQRCWMRWRSLEDLVIVIWLVTSPLTIG